jgi:predicted MFS family arabinose efflux permease
MVIAPLGQWLIDAHGWKSGIAAFAGLAASLALLALPITARSEGRQGSAFAGAGFTQVLSDALRHKGFLYLMLAFFACGFQLVFVATYLPSYLQICGVAPGVAASALGLIGLCNAIGTYGFGLLGSRYSQKHLLALIYLGRTTVIGAFLLFPISAASTMVFASAMGLLWLGVIPLVSGIIGRVFGLERFNTLYGIVFLSHQLGSFCGAWMGGAVFDHYHRFDLAWAALISIGLLAFALQWLMDERQPPRPSPAGLMPA